MRVLIFLSLVTLLAPRADAAAPAAETLAGRAGAAARAFAPLTEEEVGTAVEALGALQTGRPGQVLEIIERRRMTLDRLEQVLSAAYVLLVEIKVEEVKARGDCCLGRSAEVTEWLRTTQGQIDSYVLQYFDGRGPDYRVSRDLVRARRADLSAVLYLAGCRQH